MGWKRAGFYTFYPPHTFFLIALETLLGHSLPIPTLHHRPLHTHTHFATFNHPQVPVTYKKFGRKYTVPASMAPEKPTRAEMKRKAKTRIFFAKAAGLAAKPPATVKTRQYE